MSHSYQVLARKYRPSNFHELLGQAHVSKALINAIDHNRLHHAYLFTGTRGVGKTTIARILSKCLNCDTGVTSTPCGICDSCVAIEQGRFIDLIEIDAASRTKVEDTRELLDNVPYAPTQGRYKVYLIDEVHMLSTHSFNALLKTLEEPPEHVKFLLATTDPQKLPITIISRCLQFVLRPLAQEQLSNHLRNLLIKEHIEFEEPALWQLAHGAKGSVRDSLSLTDQAIAFGQGKVTEQNVNEMLGLINGADLISLLADIYNDDKEKVAQSIAQMREQMVDAGSIFDEIADLLHKIAMFQILPSISLNVSQTHADAIQLFANNISADVLQLYYEIVIQSRERMSMATTPMQALEMCILRMLAFRPLPSNQVIKNSETNHQNISQQQTDDVCLVINADKQTFDNDVSPEDSIHESEACIQHNLENNTCIDSMNAETTPQTLPEIVEGEDNVSVGGSQPEQKPYVNTIVDSESDVLENDLPIETQVNQIPQALNTMMIGDIVDKPDTKLKETEESLSTCHNNLENLMKNEDYQESFLESREVNHLVTTHIENNQLVNIDQLETSGSITEIEAQGTQYEDSFLVEQSLSVGATPETIAESPTDIQPQSADNNQKTHDELADPRDLLKAKKVELSGQWSVEKWDYWVYLARENQWLDSAELAFARKGVMTGECDGKSEFLSSIDGESFQAQFDSFTEKLTEQFPKASFELKLWNDTDGHGYQIEHLPENKQSERKIIARDAAIKKLNHCQVMKFLKVHAYARIGSVKMT